MTEILIQPFDPEEALNAEQIRSKVDYILDLIHSHEMRLGRSYAQLGSLLLKVESNQYWINFGYQKFSEYMRYVRDRIGRQRSQVYEYLAVAKILLPYLSESQLEDVGITKAEELKRFVKMSLVRPPIQLMDIALDSNMTAEQLRVAVNSVLHHEEEPKGKWRDLGGSYWTDEEWEEYQQAFELAKRVEPSIPQTNPDHVILKEVIIRFSQEFTSSYADIL